VQRGDEGGHDGPVDTDTLRVADAPDRVRYEARTPDGRVVATAAYQRSGQLLVLTHTEADPDLEGHGVGSRLVAGVLDDARRREVPVLPVCPFVQAFLERHPEHQDLVYRAPESTARD
jgi:predicted GNAT family acetyltransferase